MSYRPDGDTPQMDNRRLLAGRYQMLDKIGEGGAAVVYRARDQRLDRIVAIKLLRPQFTTDEASRKRFLNEARTAAGLNHPNVVDIYDFGENPDGSLFIAMQYVEGQNLKDVMHRRGRMTAADLIEIIPQVCQALTAAHTRGLIHRDVKPQNIMLDSRSNVRLTDFGIVKALSGPELTQTGMTFGTAAYLSPEQATGDPVGPASDVYGLGCVMYEMLSGSPPFTGDNPAVVAYKQVWEQPRPLHEWVPETPPALENIVMRCLNKDPARRYPSAAALAADLTSLGAAFNQPTQAVALGSIQAQANANRPISSVYPPNAETSRPIQMQASPSAVPPVRAQTTNLTGGQTTRRVGPATSASRVQVVNTGGRGSNAWLPIALVVVALGVMVCAFAAWQGNIFNIIAGNATPTPPRIISTPTNPEPTITSLPVAVASPTSEPAATDTPAPVPPTETPTEEASPTETPEPPTETPLPTIEVPPTVTPEPLPTDTPEPIVVPTDTAIPPDATLEPPTPEPTFQPDPTPPPGANSSITLDAYDFRGGYTNANGYHGRTAQWVYGQGTDYSSMTASFVIDDNPKGPGTLVIVGLDSEDEPKTLVRIVVNRDVVYEGPNPLPNDNNSGRNAPGNWGTVNFRLGPKLLQPGENTITITNLDPSDKIDYPIFVMIDSVTITW